MRLFILLVLMNCSSCDDVWESSSTVKYKIICIERHRYILTFDGGLALHVDDDGKPVKCVDKK